MKPYHYLFTLLFIVLLPMKLSAQSMELKKANRFYDNGEYFLALENYTIAETNGLKPDLETRKRITRCHYYLNDIDKARELFADIEDKLEGHDIFLYASANHRFGFYEGAIEWYEKSKKAGENPVAIDELVKGCQWALENSQFTNVVANPTSLLTFGQSFGIQYYKNGVVYSSADESKNNKNVDKQGKSFLNLYFSEVVNGDIQPAKKIFSEKLISPFHIGAICFTKDLKTMYFTKVVLLKGGKNRLKIYVVRNDGKDWGEAEELSFNSNDYDCAMPAISLDEKFLYFVSNKVGGFGGKDIYSVELKKGNSSGDMKNLGREVNTFGDEMFPVFNPDGKLYFSSDGNYGFGGLDIFSSEFLNGSWTNVKNMMQPMNSNYDDFCYVMDPTDNSKGLFSTNRVGDRKNDYIFYVRPKAEPKEEKNEDVRPVIGAEMLNEASDDNSSEKTAVVPIASNGLPTAISSVLTSTFNGTPISGATIVVKDPATGEKIGEITTDEKGMFVIDIPEAYRKEDQEFEIEVSKGSEYKSKTQIVSIKELEDLRKNGISLTPVFNDQVLDDISGMVIPYVGEQITEEGYKILDRLATYLLSNPNIVVKLNGHTDARGNRYNNLTISQLVADKCEAYLMTKGIDDKNMIPRGYAERYLLNKCKRGVYCPEGEHLKNRRVEVVVWRKLN